MSPAPHQERAFANSKLVTAGLRSLISFGLRYLADDGYKGNPHGTGVGQVLANIQLYKNGSEAVITTLESDYSRFMDNRDWGWPILSHVRSASTGVTNPISQVYPDRDAQPFHIGDVLMMHNGTVTNYNLIKRNAQIEGTGTDSWVITNLFNAWDKWSLDCWQTTCKLFDGTFALIGVHASCPHLVWVTRHKKPLYEVSIDNDAFIVLCTAREIETVLLEITETLFEYTRQAPWETWTITELPENRLLLYNIHDWSGAQDLGRITAKPTIPIITHPGVTTRRAGHTVTAGNNHPVYKIVDQLIEALEIIDLDIWELRVLYETVEETTGGIPYSPSFALKLKLFFEFLLSQPDGVDALAMLLDITPERAYERVLAA